MAGVLEQALVAIGDRQSQVLDLVHAHAEIVRRPGHPEGDHHVSIRGLERDASTGYQVATIPFDAVHGEAAAVLVHEIRSSGQVVLEGGPSGVRSAVSGTAVLDERHGRYDLRRGLSRGLRSLMGLDDVHMAQDAIYAHVKAKAKGR